ncbi:MAG: type II toxin-antitoxin system Phd/YefM family antitoxin [Proteobacteria bacterium]|nr:type II toxin-antitoxin system Phd/YefM family antitoxin [Pseudomonadota bacterium]
MSKQVSYSDAREHLKTYLDFVVQNSETLIITRKNNEDVVMMSRKDYDSMEETLYLLSSTKNRKRLLSAIKNEGKGKSVTFKSKKEMDKFFA